MGSAVLTEERVLALVDAASDAHAGLRLALALLVCHLHVELLGHVVGGILGQAFLPRHG